VKRGFIVANYFDLSGDSTRIAWYPNGRGGPVREGGPAANAPVLNYSSGSLDVSVTGKDLTISATPAGTLVTAAVKKTNIVPGGITYFVALIPTTIDDGSHAVTISTFGALAVHRGTSNVGPGQLESYTEMALNGTATNIILPD
jgi:hypothetical protein